MEGSKQNNIFQFTHIAGERIYFQRFQCRSAYMLSAKSGAIGIIGKKVIREWGDVLC